mgnify:CR=1 FL=1
MDILMKAANMKSGFNVSSNASLGEFGRAFQRSNAILFIRNESSYKIAMTNNFPEQNKANNGRRVAGHTTEKYVPFDIEDMDIFESQNNNSNTYELSTLCHNYFFICKDTQIPNIDYDPSMPDDPICSKEFVDAVTISNPGKTCWCLNNDNITAVDLLNVPVNWLSIDEHETYILTFRDGVSTSDYNTVRVSLQKN